MHAQNSVDQAILRPGNEASYHVPEISVKCVPDLLLVQVENNRNELLQHPLVTSLLNHKWNRFGAWFYFANLFFYLVYVIFLTAFALVVPNPQDDDCK